MSSEIDANSTKTNRNCAARFPTSSEYDANTTETNSNGDACFPVRSEGDANNTKTGSRTVLGARVGARQGPRST